VGKKKKVATRSSARSNGKAPKFDRVLVVSAHPDDPEFRRGRSVARMAKGGAKVTYVIVTDGSQAVKTPSRKIQSWPPFARRSSARQPRFWV